MSNKVLKYNTSKYSIINIGFLQTKTNTFENLDNTVKYYQFQVTNKVIFVHI